MARPSKAPGIGRVRINRRGERWYARFQDGTARREVALRVTQKSRAEILARRINDALEEGKPWQWVLNRTRPGEKTFRDLKTDYLARGSAWSDRTRRHNDGTLKKLVAEFGDVPLSELDRAAIEGYLARRRSAGLSKASCNRYLAAVRVILKAGVAWGYLPENPAAGIRFEREGVKLPRPYREDEIDALLAALDPETRDVATLFLHTAVRRGELVNLLWSDVDLLGETLTVRAPKNGRDRQIPLSDEGVCILKARRRAWSAESRDKVADVRVYGATADIGRRVRKAWHVLAPERREALRPVHSFRDAAITRLAAAGVPLPVVQEIAGHATVEMTRRYAEVTSADLKDAVRRVFG